MKQLKKLNEQTTVAEALTKAESELRHLVGKCASARRQARRQNKTLTPTTTYVSIVSGHGLSALRHAMHLLGLPTMEPRTPRGLLTLLLIVATIFSTIGAAQAEPLHKQRSSADYILRRQQIGAVRGTPTSRLIIGRRQIDIYRNGLMFEKDAIVGVRSR